MPTDVAGLLVRESPAGGRGVYAARRFVEGEPVIQMRGEVLRRDQVDWARHWSMQIGPDLFLCNDHTHPGIDHFLNHACEPNLGFMDGGRPRHQPWLHALRDIEPGEELCWDYATSEGDPGWSIPCLCGGPRCRGTIRGYPALDAPTRAGIRGRTLAWLLEFEGRLPG